MNFPLMIQSVPASIPVVWAAVSSSSLVRTAGCRRSKRAVARQSTSEQRYPEECYLIGLDGGKFIIFSLRSSQLVLRSTRVIAICSFGSMFTSALDTPRRLYPRLPASATVHLLSSVRHASLNSAIGRGIRASVKELPREDHQRRSGKGSGRDDNYRQSSRSSFREVGRPTFTKDSPGENGHRRTVKSSPRENGYRPNARGSFYSRPSRTEYRREEEKKWSMNNFDENEFIRTGNFRALPLEHQRPQKLSDNRKNCDADSEPQRSPRSKKNEKIKPYRSTETAPERVKEHVKVPDSIPYTTPASEFIYGTGAVEAALRCSRRKLYTLYLYLSPGEELNFTKNALRKIALAKGIKVKLAFGDWDRLLDKMSAGRPHNGCIIEASHLPQLPVKSLKKVESNEESHFSVELGSQSREEAMVNGINDRIEIHHSQERRRFPIVLLLNGIVDPGNLGAIIRSAYYLGVDAIIFAGTNSAPLSPVTIKASAGAAENMTLLEVSNEVDFIRRSKENGWRFYAADAPGPGSTFVDSSAGGETPSNNGLGFAQAPSVIMMGSEGAGLSSHIKSHADSIVSIPGSRFSMGLGVESDPARVDSLNVSVAAALLMEMFLRVPLAVSDVPQKEKKEKPRRP
ncbi:RNA methyltransferase [Aspergillus melleus]|uniref:RNA methyltransferase n=1 Tax=Aspergillus melleus TaxID=138277 RepID=UPI001E8E6DA1|nr:uncharacterized protein LDX57_009777 [Aspergillus melleus]KAH8432131.1 hypothetical protein LDX57_009777 [Aspergillus melleus]